MWHRYNGSVYVWFDKNRHSGCAEIGAVGGWEYTVEKERSVSR